MGCWMMNSTVKSCHIATDIEKAVKTVLTHRYSIMSMEQCVYLHTHVFADASMKVCATVAYLQGAEWVNFAMAKS